MCSSYHVSIPTLGSGVGAGGDGEGEAWPTELCAGLETLCSLLFWSSGLSGAGDGLGWTDGDMLLTVLPSALAVISLDVSLVMEGGDKRREPEFRFCPSASNVALLACLSPDSMFPFAE